MFGIFLFCILYIVLVHLFAPSSSTQSLSPSTYPEDVFQIIDELENTTPTKVSNTQKLEALKSVKGFVLHETWMDEISRSESQKVPEVDILSMTFSELKKVASKLKTAGYFSGKINKKGMNKKRLLDKIQHALETYPDASKLLA